MESYVVPPGVTVGCGFAGCQYSIPPAVWHFHHTTVCTTGRDCGILIHKMFIYICRVLLLLGIGTHRIIKCCYSWIFYCMIISKVAGKLNSLTVEVFFLAWFLGAFIKLGKETISFVMSSVCPSVRPSARSKSTPTGLIFTKFFI
jgi:hypothetical protein